MPGYNSIAIWSKSTKILPRPLTRARTRHLALLSLLLGGPASGSDVQSILRDLDKVWFGGGSFVEARMVVETDRYKREMSLRYWTRGKDHSLVVIESPPKERGNATLKTEGKIYNYLSKVDRTIQISSALRGGRWMGSHLTHDDLIQGTHLADDYTGKIVKKLPASWILILKPKPDKPVVWSKQIVHYDPAKKVPLLQEYYDDHGKIRRTIRYSAFKKIAGRITPTKLVVIPASEERSEKPAKTDAEESTTLTYERIDRSRPKSVSFFSMTNLKDVARSL